MTDVSITSAGVVAIVATAFLAAAFVFLYRELRARTRVEALFHGVMDATGFGVLIVLPDGTISYANNEAETMLGYSSSRLAGSSKHGLLHEGRHEDEPDGECPLERALQRGERYFGHDQFMDARRNLVPVTVSSAPLPDGAGAALVFRDRSTELAEARQRVESFAMISHEIRSPLTTVVGFSARLNRAVKNGRLEVAEQYAEEIELLARESARMRDIVTVVLDVATLDRRLELQPEPILIRRLAQDESERIEREHPGVAFDVSRVGDEVVESDERYVRRIVQNLLENAVKYAGDAGAIEVSADQRDGGVAISVRDHGPGIPWEIQGRIFDRFYRQEIVAGRRPGLGLGLYLSRQLADRLGGKLTMSSTPGEGAEFTLWLPDEAPSRPLAPPQATAELKW